MRRFGLPVTPETGRRAGTAIGIAATALIVMLSLLFRPWMRTADIASAPWDVRPIEPRISGGFPWTPFRPATRGEQLSGVAYASAIGTRRPQVSGTHVETMVAVISGGASGALAQLEASAIRSPNDVALWNDLAVAYHETAIAHDAPEFLAKALTATDRALTHTRMLEALFNRALILQRLGLRDDAREAWTRYLAADAGSAWAAEARRHMESVAAEPPFLDILDGQYERVRTDPTAAMALVRRDPFSARGRGVMVILGRWGDAILRGDPAEAERHLDVARHLGAAVARFSGDHMLERSVVAIDAAGTTGRSPLGSAHADYRRGVEALREEPVAAETMLRRAASVFEQWRSPALLAARYFAANAVFEQGRHDDAAREYHSLLATVSPEFPAYRAHLLATLGTYHASRAEWGPAIERLQDGTSLFERIGETEKAAEARRLLGFVYDRIGDRSTAWTHHLASLRGLGRQSSLTLVKELRSIGDAAIVRRDWHLALSFLNLEIAVARRIRNEHQLAATLFIRGVVRDRLNDPDAAADIAEANALTARPGDPAYRAFLQAASLRARAMLRATSCYEAEELLSHAIAYQAARSDQLELPVLLLQRARARRCTGNGVGALADLREGIADLERHRESLPRGEARWGAFHAAEELFEEAIDLCLTAGDTEAAFRFAEAARARTLLDSYGGSPALDFKRMPPSTVVVEYASLPARLVIFTADRSGVHATSVRCDRDVLAAEIDAFTRDLRSNRPSGTSATLVYGRLIEPVASHLLGAATLVFVPDHTTASMPFSAVRSASGDYLLEQHAIIVAPSAAVFVTVAARPDERTPPSSVLVMSTSKPAPGVASLPRAEAEARRVLRMYPQSIHLHDDAAEFDQLALRGPDADVIHFAGHGLGDDRGIEPASMVLSEKGRARPVGVAEIAKLHLRNTRVVVLAGCSTARGERRAAEGVISVAHGFLLGGVPSVIATLWPIDDDHSASFFPRLHARIAEGMVPAEALRSVQLEAIHRGDTPASLWAAVQNIGS